MIDKTKIRSYVLAEAKTARDNYEVFRRMSADDKIRRRKAIGGVRVADMDAGRNEMGGHMISVSYGDNLSDFKEGDSVVLRRTDGNHGVDCSVESIDDGRAMLSVFRHSDPMLHQWDRYGEELILEAGCPDMNRLNTAFFDSLQDESCYWQSHMINTKADPRMIRLDECSGELDKTLAQYGMTLTAAQREAVVRSMAADSYYLIQGPPGTGKSHVLGLIIYEELVYFHHRVGIIGPNHNAINNVLLQVAGNYPDVAESCVKIGQSYNAPKSCINPNGKLSRITNLPGGLKKGDLFAQVVGITPFGLYSRRGSDLEFDTLIIDEAGQMSIPLAMMGMIRADKMIMAGDHKQLAPIVQTEDIDDEMRESVFSHLITDGNHTLLDISFRMNEHICGFVSDLFYDGKIRSAVSQPASVSKSSNDTTDMRYPVVWVNVEDSGKQYSVAEAERVVNMVEDFLESGISKNDIAVIAPFRAQVALIGRLLSKSSQIMRGAGYITVDTVDRMQGQEREIIIYSMTTGDRAYAIETADFLYNPRKLNVALSRARNKVVIAGNIGLLRSMDMQDYPHIVRMIGSDYIEDSGIVIFGSAFIRYIRQTRLCLRVTEYRAAGKERH